MNIQRTFALLLLLLIGIRIMCSQEKPKKETEVPVSTQWLLKGVKTDQHDIINSVMLLVCPKTNKKGTGFLIKGGIVVTNNHVIEGCTALDVQGQSTLNKPVHFSNAEVDDRRDLAILLPTDNLPGGGLDLGSDIDPPVKSQVYTWGFPLSFNGPAPLLSMGYVAGYTATDDKVKHLVVNGAFNPGNSGGPLMLEGGSNKVVGVVVNRSLLFSYQSEEIIKGLEKPRGGMKGTFVKTLPDGTKQSIFDSEAVAMVLREFYNDVQVMIGEAISVSELRAFLKAHEAPLRKKP